MYLCLNLNLYVIVVPVFAIDPWLVFVHTSASCQAGKVGVVGRRGAIAGKSASRDAAL